MKSVALVGSRRMTHCRNVTHSLAHTHRVWSSSQLIRTLQNLHGLLPSLLTRSSQEETTDNRTQSSLTQYFSLVDNNSRVLNYFTGLKFLRYLIKKFVDLIRCSVLWSAELTWSCSGCRQMTEILPLKFRLWEYAKNIIGILHVVAFLSWRKIIKKKFKSYFYFKLFWAVTVLCCCGLV